MGKLARCIALGLAVAGPHLVLPSRASGQAAAPSATASFPPLPAAPSPSPAPAPALPPASASVPAAAAVPVAAAPVAPPAPLPPPTAAPPSPGPAYPAPQPNTQTYPGGAPPPPPPPPPQEPEQSFKIPDISLRVDPFNLLLEGRLGVELETALYKLLSLELVPVFVTTQSPPTLNYSTYEKSSLHQESNGWGPLSGAALDLGIWFGGKPFKGAVLRTGFTNYAYTYKTTAPANDSVSHTSRQFFAMIGSHSRWSAFTIAYGIGLAYELNQENRCFDRPGNPTSSCDKDQLLIKLNQSGSAVADLHSYLYPFDFLARFSLGVVF